MDVLLEIAAHHALHGVAIEADDLGQHIAREHRGPGGLLLEDDLEQDAAGEVLVGLGVLYLERHLRQHELLDVSKRDVSACFRIVKPAVGVLLDDPGRWRHGMAALAGCAIIPPYRSHCKRKGLKNIGKSDRSATLRRTK